MKTKPKIKLTPINDSKASVAKDSQRKLDLLTAEMEDIFYLTQVLGVPYMGT